MKFRVLRASDGSLQRKQPCDGAFYEPHPTAGEKYGGWYVEIPTLEALIDLHKAVKDDIIVSEDKICIYDDYVE